MSKIKLINIEECPYWDSDNACWDCPRFDNQKGKKEICPFHKDQTFESQKRALWLLDKIHLNAEFGKLSRSIKEFSLDEKRYWNLPFKKFKDNQFLEWNVLEHAILNEGKNQVRKWGVQEHTLAEWLMYTTEELGELSKAISEYVYRKGTVSEIYREAIQTATLALKIAEMVFTDG